MAVLMAVHYEVMHSIVTCIDAATGAHRLVEIRGRIRHCCQPVEVTSTGHIRDTDWLSLRLGRAVGMALCEPCVRLAAFALPPKDLHPTPDPTDTSKR